MKKNETLITFTHKGRSVTVTESTLAKAARVLGRRSETKIPPLKIRGARGVVKDKKEQS